MKKQLGNNIHIIWVHTIRVYLLITKRKPGDTACTESWLLSLMMGQTGVPDVMNCKWRFTYMLLLPNISPDSNHD